MGMGNGQTGGNTGTDPSSGFRPVTTPIPAPDTGQVSPWLVPTQLPTQPPPPAQAPPPQFGGLMGSGMAAKAVQPTVAPAQFAVAPQPVARPSIRAALGTAMSSAPAAAHPVMSVPPSGGVVDPGVGNTGSGTGSTGANPTGTGADPAALASRLRGNGGANGRVR